MDNLYLDQVILQLASNQNTLNLVLTNNTELIHSYSVLKTAYSDHNSTIEVTTNSFSTKNDKLCMQPMSSDEPPLRQLNFFSDKVKWGAYAVAARGRGAHLRPISP